MVRAVIFVILFSTTVWANDIYVEQSETQNETSTVALKTKDNTGSTYQQPKDGTTFEKSLIVPTETQYCSVVAGCYVQE